MADPDPVRVEVGRNFKLVFLAVLFLSVLSLGISVALAVFVKDPGEPVKNLIETCSTVFKLGCGAVFGLLGGKALA